MAPTRFGLDVGGTGIKGAVVDLDRGQLVTERRRILTPQPATPAAVTAIARQVVEQSDYSGAVGCAFPAVVKNGTALTAANIDKSWIGTSISGAMSAALGGAMVTAINDADAAGVAEVHFGAGKGVRGVVVMLTIGTGVGSAVFLDGRLVPNTELGHIEVDGHDGERRASETAREEHGWSRHVWAKHFNRYLEVLEGLLWPDLIILGGGVSKAPERFMPLLEARAKVVPAALANTAGIIGAAMSTLH